MALAARAFPLLVLSGIATVTWPGMGSIRCPSGSKQIPVFRSVGGANECMAEMDATGSAGKVCARELVATVPAGQKALWDGCAFVGATCFNKVKLVGGRHAGESGVVP